MSSIDENSELDRVHPPEIDQGPKRGTNGPSCVQHVIDENDVLVVDVRGYFRATDDRLYGDFGQIIAIQIDIENPHLWRFPSPAGDVFCHALCHGNASALNAQKNYRFS